MNATSVTNRPSLYLILSFSLIGGLYILFFASNMALMIAMHAPDHPRVMTATQELPQSDFARFWYVGKSLSVNAAKNLGFHIQFSPPLKSTFKIDILNPSERSTSAWLYPPTMGLLAIPFSILPLTYSFWAWRLSTLLIASALLRVAGLQWSMIIMGLISPAELHDLAGGQNGALMGGLLVSALMMVDKRPRASGVIMGILSIKPQIAVTLPVILLRRIRLKTLFWCGMTASVLVLLSIILEGWESWRWFIMVAQPTTARILSMPVSEIFQAGGCTVFMMARSFHATLGAAWTFQIVSSAISMYIIWSTWGQSTTDPMGRMALTVCLTILITPYGFVYDLVGFSIAVAAIFIKAPDWQKPFFGLIWLSCGYTITLANLTGFILMPFAAFAAAFIIFLQIKGIIKTNSQ